MLEKAEKTNKKVKKRHPIKTVFSLTAIVVACILIVIAAQDILTTMSLQKEISSSESQISELTQQQSTLSTTKENLNNPEYLKRYARGRYMVSKPGEQIFKLPSKSAEGTEDK